MARVEKEKILDSVIYVKKEMPEVLYRAEILDGEPVSLIYDAVKKEMYHLKGNSGKIWKLIDGKRTLRMIAQELKTMTGASDEKILIKDVITFVVKLGRLQLIQFAYTQGSDKENSYDAMEEISR